MKPVQILLIGSALLMTLAGCLGSGDLKAYGVAPWPIYKEPDALNFTDAEKATLTKFAADNAELFKKIQGQSHAWRAIVQAHNKRALEINQNQLKALGYDEATVRQVYPLPKPKESLELKKEQVKDIDRWRDENPELFAQLFGNQHPLSIEPEAPVEVIELPAPKANGISL
jgi:hypothetical protein